MPQHTGSSCHYNAPLHGLSIACGALLRYPFGHFAAYIGAGFEQIVTDEIAFLRRHLLMPIPASALVAEGHAAP